MGCAVVLLACGGDDDGLSDGGFDASAEDAPDVGIDVNAPTVPWPHRLPDTAELGDRRGRRLARTIIHLHSPLSHDACDGEGFVDGALADETCLAHFRDSLCALRIDAAMVTDHAPHLNEVTLEEALWIQPGDAPVTDESGGVFANRIACEDGHRTLVTVGSENAIMPLGLRRHPGDPDAPSTPEELITLYDGRDAAAAEVFREAGALIWVAHTEEHPLDFFREIDVDGIELYNLHADVDPRIRSEHLGLEDGGYLGELLKFGRPAFRLEPDLAVLAFLSRQGVSLDKWDTLLAEGTRVAGSGGCDAHENALSMPLGDGERGDSYRRMMIWITNHLLVDVPASGVVEPDAVEDALDAGRFYVTHEVFGTPMGFDFTANEGGAVFEMGEDAPLGSTLRVVRPTLPDGFPQNPGPTVTLHLIRSEEGGGVEVAMAAEGDIEFVVDEAGAYRAEVRMMPEHAREYVRATADVLIHEVNWVYSNPIFVGVPVAERAPLPDALRARVGRDQSAYFRARAERALSGLRAVDPPGR